MQIAANIDANYAPYRQTRPHNRLARHSLLPSQRHRRAGVAVRDQDETVSPAPDMSWLQTTRHPAPVFPAEIFGPWQGWVEQTAEGAAAPVDYVAGGLLSTAASLIGNARWARAWDSWNEPCVLWIANVGTPSSNKSPATDSNKRILREIENNLATPYQDELREWKGLEEAAKCRKAAWEAEVEKATKAKSTPPPLPSDAIAPPKPARPRLVVSDTTQEKLCALMESQPKGLLQERDELAGWLHGMDRYGGNGADRAFYLEAYGGRPYSVDRVKHDQPIIIPRLSVSVIGNIQPDKLNSALLAGDDDGLSARFFYIWPERVPANRPSKFADNAFAKTALGRLAELRLSEDSEGNLHPRYVPLCSSAADVFGKWWSDHCAVVDTESGLFASHLGKYPGLVLRLALVLEFLWWSGTEGEPEPAAISEMAITAAIGLATDYFIPMARRAFGDAAVTADERNATALARWIIKTKSRNFNGRALYRSKTIPGISTSAAMSAAVDHLIQDGWVYAPARAEGKGRPKSDYIINPRAYELANA